MLLTYCLTVRLLAQQRQNIGGPNQTGPGWASGWLGQTPALGKLHLNQLSYSKCITTNIKEYMRVIIVVILPILVSNTLNTVNILKNYKIIH